MKYEIFSDSSSNLTDDLIDKLQLKVVSLVYVLGGVEFTSYVKGRNNDLKEFYNLLRQKQEISTSCVNCQTFIDAFEPVLQSGKDLLYIGFSSALSATFHAAETACENLREKYPDRKILCVDTLGASLGQGLLCYYACNMRLDGKSIDEAYSFVQNNKLNLAHWFTVDDLYWLFKGGRITKSAYWAASIAKIKPVLHMDNLGRLVPVHKVIGRKKSIITLADHVASSIVNPDSQMIFISHGDCIDDVELLQKKISERINVKGFYSNYVDPVVGAHSGPGTLAVFCLADKR
ncbi:MAG: DegV family protein [Clostridia bacterium]